MEGSGGGFGRLARRGRNLAVRLLKGLPPTGAAVSPDIDNDLYQAHLSVYLFAAGFAGEGRCLDLGCGTGYGSAVLAEGGAAEVVGVDRERRCLAYARKRFAGPGVTFRLGQAEDLPEGLGEFDCAVALGLLPELADPGAGLASLAARLSPGGRAVLSVPPILDGQTMDRHRAIERHRSNLYLWDWEELLAGRFASLRLFRHQPPPDRLPDFSHPGPSRIPAAAYAFEELPLAEIYDAGSLTAVFVAAEPREP